MAKKVYRMYLIGTCDLSCFCIQFSTAPGLAGCMEDMPVWAGVGGVDYF